MKGNQMSSNDTENASASQPLVASQFASTPFQESVFQDSVLSEVTPGVATSSPTGVGQAALAADRNTPPTDEEKILFPLLGSVSIPSLLRNLYFGLALFLSLTFTLTYYSFKHSEETALKVKTVGESLMQAQRMAKSANEALIGGAGGFDELRDSSGQLKSGLDRLEAGSLLDPLVGAAVGDQAKNARLEDVSVLADRSLRAVGVILSQKMLLTGVSDSLKALNKSSDDLLDSIREIIAEKMKKSATTSEISALGEMAALSQRIAKSANEFFTTQGVSPQAVFLLRQDIASFETMTLALLNGDASLKLSPTKDPAIRAQVEALFNQFKEIKQSAQQISDNLPRLAQAREAQALIIKDSEKLRINLGVLGASYLEDQDVYEDPRSALAIAAALSVFAIVALIGIQLLGARQRRDLAVRRALEAQDLTKMTQQVNDAIQVAILRLMNELQAVAEGDLTRQATVTEDITGAIADSINYTVEELRVLVTNVQLTADRVAKTTAQVGTTTSAQLATSNQQLREIRQTGLSVLEMAGRINDVSSRAQQSAEVARQSLEASNSGLLAVQNTIGGMNTLREQIQETSKRIKRLGESSQEIGEITEIISDITEQTNVLALNAAIQAASAGEAGRGFAVVAEEVQRLAVRSAEATQQIANLVRAIQSDTQDAIGAMERSAQDVVSGATLSDKAGAALTDIDRITRRVADQVEQISETASREAAMANDVAKSIQHIFAVTEQTEKESLATSAEVQRLSTVANELRKSVTRFKVS
jgi:twitching motility protein PilJ